MRKLLLSLGTNHTLLGVRNAVFVDAGYDVVPVKSGAAALDAIRSRHLSAVVIGHSLSRALKERITDAAKEQQLPVIVLHAHDYEAPVVGADANLCGIDGASTILRLLTELLGQDSDERSRPQRQRNQPAPPANAVNATRL
jgi:DNA-binding NtrC family response regulator